MKTALAPIFLSIPSDIVYCGCVQAKITDGSEGIGRFGGRSRGAFRWGRRKTCEHRAFFCKYGRLFVVNWVTRFFFSV